MSLLLPTGSGPGQGYAWAHLPPPSAIEPPARPSTTWPYRHLALIQRVQEEGHAVRAQVAVLAGEVVGHLQQVLLLGRVALVGVRQLGDVDSVLGNDPVPVIGVALIGLCEARPGCREPSIHLSCQGLCPHNCLGGKYHY